MSKNKIDSDMNSGTNSSILRHQNSTTLLELQNFQSLLNENRAKFMKKLSDYIAQIQSKLSDLKLEVHGDFSMEMRDADYYRVNMFQLESSITELKQSINIELCNLIKAEDEICRDLQFMERRVEEWNKAGNQKSVKSAISLCKPASRSNNDLSSDFDKFLLATGGHTGGWDEQDHLIFIRERNKFHAKPKFITSLQCLLPGKNIYNLPQIIKLEKRLGAYQQTTYTNINECEIMAHENWFKKYIELKKAQREAIRKWRASRQSSLEKRQDSSTDERECSAQKSQPRNYAAQRDITERIKEWKRQQLIKKAEEEERQREELSRQNEERQRKKELQRAKKCVVNTYKEAKLSKLQAEMLSQQMKELQALEDKAKKSVLLKAFREQDQQLLEKRKMQKFQRELKEKQRLERIQNVKPSIELAVDRDPQRILQATQTWHHRVSQQTDITQVPQPLNLLTIPHLAVPTWRKGLSYTQTL